jgi:hypothetical protein
VTIKHIQITPENYIGIEDLNDMLCDIVENSHGISVDTLSFSVDVSYTEKEDKNDDN